MTSLAPSCRRFVLILTARSVDVIGFLPSLHPPSLKSL
jgi:hypothetical protein